MQRVTFWPLVVATTLLCGCGGTGAGNLGVTELLPQPIQSQLAATETEETNLTQQLLDLPKPAEVDLSLWVELKATFGQAIRETQAQKRTAQAPSGMANEITGLVVVVEEDGSATFSWPYRNIGDYNQDMEVGVPDLTEIAVNWYADANDGENDAAEQVVDGDSNGEVSGSDISQIAIHFSSTVDGYTLQVKFLGSEEWVDVAVIPFESGTPPPGGGWLRFEYTLQLPVDGASYRVVPFFGDSGESLGQPSTPAIFDSSSLGKPQNVAATDGTIAGAIELTWSPMAGAATFRIFSSPTEPGTYNLLDSSTPLSTNYVHSGLDGGEQVWYKLQGVLAGGVTPFSAAVKGSTMVRPGQVSNLAASEGQFYDHIQLEWDAVVGAASYRAMRSLSSGGAFSEIAVVAGTVYDDFAITPGTPYFYQIVASNDAGDAPPGAEVSGRAAIPGDPPAVVGVSPTIGASGAGVEFTALISGGMVDLYAWHFGGGATPNASPVSNPAVSLGVAGVYNATLTVSNAFGQDSFLFTLDVGNPPDITSVTPTVGVSGESMVFVPEYSSTVDSWSWDFGGAGTPGTSGGEEPEILLGAGGEYMASVVATNQYGNDSYGFTITVLAPPGIPGGLQATDGTQVGRIRLSWAKPPLATGYKVYRDSQDTPVMALGDVDSWDDTSAEAQDFSLHEYWVVATNDDGSSGFSDPDTGYARLPAPQGFLATDGTLVGRVRLSWTQSAGATGYNIYRDNTSPAYDTVGDVDTYDDTSLPDYASHVYWVSAVNANPGESDLSQSDSGFLGIAAPTGVTASQGTFTGWIRVGWTKPSGATGYKVYRDGTSEGDVVSGELGDLDTWDDTSVSDYSSHTYYVRAFNALAQSALSSSSSGFRGLEAPGGFAASDATFTDRIRLTWSTVTGAGDYKVYRGTESNLVHTTSSGDGSTVQWDDMSISDFETYEYWIKAFNANGDGPSSQDSGFMAFGGSWDSHAIDSSGVVGNWSSLQIIGGKPAVSYFDTAGGIKYARATTANPTQASDWVYHTVDGLPLAGGNNLGNLGADLAELNGKPIIAYHNAFTGDLQIAKADIAAPSSDSDWTIYVLDATDDVGTYPKLVVVDGYLAVSYRDHTAGSIKFAMAKEQDPLDGSATYWDVYTMDSANNLGFEGIDMLLLGGKPVVSYYDLTNGDLMFAESSVARPTAAGSWSISQVATTGVVGRWPCLAEIDGKPAVSYYDIANTSLLFARATVTSPSGTSDWVAMDVDTDGDCGNFGTSLLTVGGRPNIAYFRDGTQDLRYSAAFSAAPSAPADWYTVEVDTAASTGYYPSQIMLGGLPAMTYRGGDVLMFAVPAT